MFCNTAIHVYIRICMYTDTKLLYHNRIQEFVICSRLSNIGLQYFVSIASSYGHTCRLVAIKLQALRLFLRDAMHNLSATSHFILSCGNSCACVIVPTNAPFPSKHSIFIVHGAFAPTLTWFKSFKLH